MKLVGLQNVSSESLKKLLSAVYQEHVQCPLTIEALTRVGLQFCADQILTVLRDFDERSVRVIITTVLAERNDE